MFDINILICSNPMRAVLKMYKYNSSETEFTLYILISYLKMHDFKLQNYFKIYREYSFQKAS